MSWDDAAKIITAIAAVSGTVGALWRWAVAIGKRDALAEQTKATLVAKDEEIAELEAEVAQLTAWLDALTRPPGRSQ